MIILPIVSIPIGLALAYQLRANHPHPKPIHGDEKVRLQASVGIYCHPGDCGYAAILVTGEHDQFCAEIH